MKLAVLRRRTLLLVLIGLISCSKDEQEATPLFTPVDLAQPWQTSNATEERIGDLSSLAANAAKLKRLTSLLIFRNGKLVREEYYNGFKKDSLHDVRSVTKSVVALLVGVALEKGFFKSVQDPIGDYLKPPEFTLTEQQKNITLLQLLTMTGGFEWDETDGNSYNEWILSNRPIEFLLEKPLTDTPGSTFNYNSAAVHLLGIVLNKATGVNVPDFANQNLFSKLGIDDVEWEQFDDHYVNGGSGIRLRPQDMAKIGQLVLQKGMSGSQSVVSEDWIKSITDPAFSWRDSYGVLKNHTYSRLWWIQDAPSAKAFFAWGFGGQFIYVLPEKNLVIVITTNWIKSAEAGGSYAITQEALDLIINKILPVVQ